MFTLFHYFVSNDFLSICIVVICIIVASRVLLFMNLNLSEKILNLII